MTGQPRENVAIFNPLVLPLPSWHPDGPDGAVDGFVIPVPTANKEAFIEQARDLLIWHRGMHWVEWAKMAALSVVMAVLGFAWFQKTRKGFADVL